MTASRAERDAQQVIASVVEIILANRELRPMVRTMPAALKVSAEMETKARAALRSACILWFHGDTLADLGPPAA